MPSHSLNPVIYNNLLEFLALYTFWDLHLPCQYSKNLHHLLISLEVLFHLISVATSKCEAATPTWEKLPDTPFLCAGLVAYDNSLLAIGGFNAQNVPGIHAYNPDMNEWINIGYLPTALHVSISVVYLQKSSLLLLDRMKCI